MMRQQSSRFTVPNWVKWAGSIAAFVLILLLGLFIWLYVNVQDYKTSGFDQARRVVAEETDDITVTDVSIYYGDTAVHMVEGESNGSQRLFIVDTETKKVLEEISLDGKLNPSEMKSQWRNQCNDCQFQKLQYAFEEGKAVYEITYVDSEGRYVLDYYQLNGEKFDQRFAFKQSS